MYIYPKGIEVTMNKMGVTTTTPNEIAEAFIDFASTTQGNLIDIGAAYGVATIPALEKGACVTACDISADHLQKLIQNTPQHLQRKLTYKVGGLPNQLYFEAGYFDGILISQVLHFISGKDIEESIQNIYQWLKPGGKVFILVVTPYVNTFKNFIPVYEKRKASGITWPGEVENIQQYASHPSTEDIPSFMHCIEQDIMEKVFQEAGFIIEVSKTFTSKIMPEEFQLDGREMVYLIAKKPMK